MPTVDLKPVANAPWQSGWGVTGAPTAWQALADEAASSFIFHAPATDMAAVLFEPLPGDAAAIQSVFAVVDAGAGSNPGGLSSRIKVFDGAGVSSQVYVYVPLDQGSEQLIHDFPLAPDGGAWTVAKANDCAMAFQNAADFPDALIVERARLRVIYTTANPDELVLERVRIVAPIAGRKHVAAPGRRTPLLAPAGLARTHVRAPANRVDLLVPAGGRVAIRIHPESP